MSSRIIRGDDYGKKTAIRSIAFELDPGSRPEDQIHRAEKQAFDKGYREGERAGRQTGEQMIATTVKRYEQTAAELAKAYGEIVRAMETRTAELAIEIARKVIQREINSDPELVCALAVVAVRRVQSHQNITLRVSRYDFHGIQEAVGAVNTAVTVVEDASLERGDFMIDTSQTHVDGRVQSQMETLGEAILAE